MKVFISWSGHTSHKVALVLRDWIPSVIQSIQPYVSSEDIDKGARWATDIAGELDESSYGILCVTKENVTAPWLNFEAGALGKSVDKSRVCPFLFRVKRSEVEGPLLQFQSSVYDQEDVLKLLKSLNKACADDGIEEGRLEKAFGVWWPALQNELEQIQDESSAKAVQNQTTTVQEKEPYTEKILEEILELTRMNQKLLRSPEEIFPPDYLRHVMEREGSIRFKELEMNHQVFDDLFVGYLEMVRRIKEILDKCPGNNCSAEVMEALRIMRSPMRYILKRTRRSIKYIKELDMLLG